MGTSGGTCLTVWGLDNQVACHPGGTRANMNTE